jgi:hypothetical protein
MIPTTVDPLLERWNQGAPLVPPTYGVQLKAG